MTQSPVALYSNEYTLPPDRLGTLTPSDPNNDINDLREQFKAQGYLWLKGILPRAEVLGFRKRYFTALQSTGMLAPTSQPIDGIDSGAEISKRDVQRITMEAVRWAAYESFCLLPEIWQFYEKLLEDAVYLHKRKILRHVRPGSQSATGAHYDLVYLRGGSDSVCSSWIPLGDIPVEMGGLIYLEGSDAYGRQQEAAFNAKSHDLTPEERVSAYNKNMTSSGWLTKDLPALAEKANSRWLTADYEVGDMVIHSAYMIHAATNNTSDNEIRLSTDIRYQRITDEIDARWQNHWSLDDML